MKAIFPTKIVVSFPTTPPAPLPPAHPYYEPSNDFIQRHKLHIDEAEVWVELSDTGDYQTYTKTIRFSKNTGETVVSKWHKSHVFNEPPFEETLFIGFLPDEQALENIITYTKW